MAKDKLGHGSEKHYVVHRLINGTEELLSTHRTREAAQKRLEHHNRYGGGGVHIFSKYPMNRG